jgi:hypothetical protein
MVCLLAHFLICKLFSIISKIKTIPVRESVNDAVQADDYWWYLFCIQLLHLKLQYLHLILFNVFLIYIHNQRVKYHIRGCTKPQKCISNLVIICDVTGISVKCKQSENLNIFNQSVSVDELLPIKAHLNMRGVTVLWECAHGLQNPTFSNLLDFRF